MRRRSDVESLVDPSQLEWNLRKFPTWAGDRIHWDTYFQDDGDVEALAVTLDRLMSELPEVQRETIRARVFEKLTWPEIAEDNGWLDASGKPQIERAREVYATGIATLRRLYAG